MIRIFFFSLTKVFQLVFQAISCQIFHHRINLRSLAVVCLFLPLFLLLQIFHWIGFFLDELLFRSYRKIEIKKPVFIIGIPRSGTTFLHRVLAADTQFSTMQTWECLLAPSITERKIWFTMQALDRKAGRPTYSLLQWLANRTLGRFKDVHKIELNAPEEDYLTLLPILSCFLLVLPFPDVEFLWRLGRFDHAVSDQDKSLILRFYRKMLQKHLFVHGADKTILSKNAAFPSLINSLATSFPDCRIICPSRQVDRALLSQLSSISGAIRFFGHADRAPLFRDRFRDLFIYYYRHLQAYLQQLENERYTTVRMEEMRTGLPRLIRRLYRHFSLTMDRNMCLHLAREDRRAKAYRSSHVYQLDMFQINDQWLDKYFAELHQDSSLFDHAETERQEKVPDIETTSASLYSTSPPRSSL